MLSVKWQQFCLSLNVLKQIIIIIIVIVTITITITIIIIIIIIIIITSDAPCWNTGVTIYITK